MTKKIKTKAEKCLQALLRGELLNRKNLGDMGLAENNDSLHSYISYLINKRFIPIQSTKNLDGTHDYFMCPKEIERFKNRLLRIEQQDHMKVLIEVERQRKIIEEFSRFLIRLKTFPELWCYWPELWFCLGDISKDINALLGNE
jgi:site-specific recombinase XerC